MGNVVLLLALVVVVVLQNGESRLAIAVRQRSSALEKTQKYTRRGRSYSRMLIKTVNGERYTFEEVQSSEKIMTDQIHEWESKEHETNERTKGLWVVINETRKEINTIKQRRAAKEQVLERFECKIKETAARLDEVEARTARNRADTRLDQMAKAKMKKIREQMKLLNENQAIKTAEIMDGLLDTDMLERQRHAVINREIRIQERERVAKDELMFLINRSDEVKLSIRRHVESIKQKHAKIFELEPKIKESIKRSDVVPPRIHELRQKIKKYAPPQKAIECYKVKNPDVIKAFERFT